MGGTGSVSEITIRCDAWATGDFDGFATMRPIRILPVARRSLDRYNRARTTSRTTHRVAILEGARHTKGKN
jgi:hypothetical protein